MAIRDYICCKSCGWKFIYDGYYSIRDELDASYGTCDLICPSCLDELEVKLAKLEQVQQEQAQAVPVGYCLMPREPTQWMREQIACGIESNSVADVWGRLIRAVDIENKHRAKEPAQAVPVAWLRPDKCHVDFHKHPGYLPLYTVPPAIDDEIRKSILELCRLIIDKAGPDSMITRAMAQKAEKISERLEAGNDRAT